MAVAGDTPTCFRRRECVECEGIGVEIVTLTTEKLPIPYLNGKAYCDPLGDFSVWGSLFNLSSDSQVIMLAAKVKLYEVGMYVFNAACNLVLNEQLDSVSFFPSSFSYGASSEVAAIATLLAVLQQLGEIKRDVSTSWLHICW